MTQALAIALALVLAGSGTAIWYLDGKLTTANARASAAESSRAKEEQSRKGFEAAAITCGESVAKLKATADSIVRGYQNRLKASLAQTASAEALVATILSKDRPVGLDECAATKKELDDEIERRHPPRP